MNIHFQVKSAAISVALAALISCGGGGGGGGGGDTALQYSGNTSAAAITTNNAAALVANLAGGNEVAQATSSVASPDQASSGQRAIDLTRPLRHALRGALENQEGDSGLTSVAIDSGPEPCDNGGTVRVVGDVDPGSGRGTATVTYTNCQIGQDTLSGQATMQINGMVTFVPTDFTISFSRLTLRGSVNIDIGGSVRVVTGLPVNRETITENVVALYNNTGRMTKSEKMVYVNQYDNINSPTTYTQSMTGRLFDSVHGFVDVSTIAPLLFSSVAQSFPNGGVLDLTGANGRQIQATAFSSNRVKVALNVDSVPGFETVAFLGWTELSGPLGADLRDSDADGMHNSWETVNPTASDRAADTDGDGFSNLSEYLGGGNPTNNAVIPALSIGAPFPVASDIATANSDTEIPGRSAISSDGISHYLVVSCRQLGVTPGVFGTLVQKDATVLATTAISTDTCPQRTAVAFGGGNYLVVVSRGGQLFGMRVTAAGAALDGAGFAISTPGSNFSPAVAFDGANFLVVWNKFVGGTQYEIYGARVTPSGSIASTEFPLYAAAGEQISPALAFDGANYLVVWRDTASGSGPSADSHIVGARVTASGTVLDPNGIAIATVPGAKDPSGVAFDGTNYLVVWNHIPSFNEGKIFGRRVSPAGTLLDGAASSDGMPIATAPFFNHSPSVAFTGTTFLVTWAVGAFPNTPPAGIYAARISKAGVRLDGAPTELGASVSGPPTTFARFVHPVAAAGPDAALIAWANNIELSSSQKDIIAAPVLAP